MTWIRLAFLNLTRNLRRTLLSLAAVVVGVWVLIVGRGFIGGIEESIVRTQIDTVSAHVSVRPAGYPTEGLQSPVDDLIEVEPLRAALDGVGVAWTPRLLFTPRAVHGADALRVRAIGFDPATDDAVFPHDGWNVDGRVPARAEDGVLVGVGLARLLSVGPGDRVVLQVRTSAGALNALDVPVAGLVRVGSPMIDRVGMLVPMDLARDLVQAEGRTSHLAIRLRNRDDAARAAAALGAALGPTVEVHSYLDDVTDYLRVQAIRRRALDLIALALLGMSAAGIANTVLMAAYERVREIGTLRAMGMTEGGVIRLFLVEGAMMGAAGAVVGGAVGTAMVGWWSVYGIDLSGAVSQVGTNIPFQAVLYTRVDPLTVAGAMAFGVVIAVLASLLPARMASRMVPADAVRA